MPYILEVQHFFIDGHNTHPEWNGKKEHNWCSDWDPQTNLLYVIRKYTGEFLKISHFA
jgi:hypothetical protein